MATVAIVSVDAQGFLTPLPSSPISLLTPDTARHSLVVRDRTRFGIQFRFGLVLLDASQAELVEHAIRIDGFNVAHGHVPVTEIRADGGVLNILRFPDGMTGMAKTAEFRALATGRMNHLVLAV